MDTNPTLGVIALAIIATSLSGCAIYRTVFKPDQQAVFEIERAKKRQVKDFSAEIVWENSQNTSQNGITRMYDFVFYDYGDGLSLIRYMRTEGYPTVAQEVITKVSDGGCWYSGSQSGYRYGWSGEVGHDVLERKRVVNVTHIYTNCGEFKETTAWPAISKVIPDRLVADTQANGSRVIGKQKETY